MNLLQQYNRCENIEISNIPDTIENHELEYVVIGILRRIGVDNLESWEIAACHRLKKKRKNEQFGNIIIRFTNRKRAIQCLKYKKYLKDYICEYPKIYIHENLCPRFRSIFEDCEKMKAEDEIKKLWTFNGIVNLKKSDNINERLKNFYQDNDFEKFFPYQEFQKLYPPCNLYNIVLPVLDTIF